MSADDEPHVDELTLRDLARCFDGRVPAVIATAAADGTPNVTYLSAVHMVDDRRVALSNQFMSKTSRNLAERPLATLLLLDPVSWSEYRLVVRYERTDRRGPVFERLRDDVDHVASLIGMRDVFRLRSADVCRVESIDLVLDLDDTAPDGSRRRDILLGAAGELIGRMSRVSGLEHLVDVALGGLDELLGYRHSSLMLVDETRTSLFTLASRGFPYEGVGSEVAIGDGVAGTAAETCAPVRTGQFRHLMRYARSVRTSFEAAKLTESGRDTPVPELIDAQSRIAVPAMVRGELVGVLVVDSPLPVAFDDDDEQVLTIVAAYLAQMIETDRSAAVDESTPPTPPPTAVPPADDQPTVAVRYFAEDGTAFLDGEYLIRGVAGRVLWSIVQRHLNSGQVEFATKELRLDKSLELPGFRDNLDTRLVMLMRRLDERNAPIRLERSGRGRFRLLLNCQLAVEEHA